MNLSTIVIIIYGIGIIIGALFLDLWGAETSLSKAMAGVVWTVLFLPAHKKDSKLLVFQLNFYLNNLQNMLDHLNSP